MDESLTERGTRLVRNARGRLQAFFVALPLIMPGVIFRCADGVHAGIDRRFRDHFFHRRRGRSRCPLQIYSMIKIASPQVNAVSTLLMLLTLALMYLASRLTPSLLRSD
jgi:spermidine/putrescine transport system permease protein